MYMLSCFCVCVWCMWQQILIVVVLLIEQRCQLRSQVALPHKVLSTEPGSTKSLKEAQ
jgi:hypothetical protein